MKALGRFFLALFIELSVVTGFSQNQGMVSGNVTEDSKPLTGVHIALKDRDIATQTDSMGDYTIPANPGNTLVFSHVGMQSVEVLLEDVTRVLNIEMKLDVQELDEVVVEKRKRKGQKQLEREYVHNKRLVRTNFGIIDADRAGFTIRVVDEEDIDPAFLDIPLLLQAKFPGIYVKRTMMDDSGSQFMAYLNRTKTLNKEIPVLYEIDGVLTRNLPFVPVTEIKRIALISGVGGTIRYGTRGAGGVVVINTKQGVANKKTVNKTELGVRYFDGYDVVEIQNQAQPKYVEPFKTSRSINEAIAIYNQDKSLHEGDPYYFLEVHSYIFKRWGHYEILDEIENLLLLNFGKNPVVLKSLAYHFEEKRDFEKALRIYQKVFQSRPNYRQSYRDVANAYYRLGQTTTAFRFYLAMDSLPNFNKKKEGIDFTVLTELNALVRQNGNKKKFLNKVEFDKIPHGTRLLFEWSHGEAEFDLQFVNSKNEYFTWEHTFGKNKERILDEKVRGYSSEQFFLNKIKEGNWQVNLKYHGNKSNAPTYLKVTVWDDFGHSSENKVVKLFRLQEENINFKLLSTLN